ncbi:MAG: SpoIID/LytB domain-containing protein [Candidatus Limnocylindrales bacterium]
MRRRLAAILVLTATIWLPAVSTAPPVMAGTVCTGWTSTRIPPTTIRVYRTSGSSAGTVQTVDFNTYVKVVLAAEWPPTWPTATLQSGAVVVKEYAWYYAMHWRGGSGTGGCFDVVDNSNDQIYWPEGKTPTAGEAAAVDSTWYESMTKGGSIILTGYRTGADVACGSDSDGLHLMQYSARNCAASGLTADQILQTYFSPGLAIWKPAVAPAAVFESPGSGEPLTAGSSATAAWSEEPAAGTTVVARNIALQMAAPINGSCSVDRWLPASPPWTSTGASPQTVADLKTGYCYRFVVGLSDSAASTTYAASSTMMVDPLAPVATFTNPANGTIASITDPSVAVAWTETSAPGTSIYTRALTTEYAAEPVPGSCAGALWLPGNTTYLVSGNVVGGLARYYCYRWRLTLTDTTGRSGTWLSGAVIEPAS